MAVSDVLKAKAFYVDKLGLKVVTDYRLNSTSTLDKNRHSCPLFMRLSGQGMRALRTLSSSRRA